MLKYLSNSYSERGGGAAISGHYEPAWTRRLWASCEAYGMEQTKTSRRAYMYM